LPTRSIHKSKRSENPAPGEQDELAIYLILAHRGHVIYHFLCADEHTTTSVGYTLPKLGGIPRIRCAIYGSPVQ
jgi:hypothetical protein